MIDKLEKYKKDEVMTDYYLDLLNNLNSELGIHVPAEQEPLEDSQHIDDALFDIVAGVINSFQLDFTDQHFNMIFERRGENVLQWSIGPEANKKNRQFPKKRQRMLVNLGFNVDAETERYVYHYDLSNFRNALEIKTLLARVVYDVFIRWYPYETPKVELRRECWDEE